MLFGNIIAQLRLAAAKPQQQQLAVYHSLKWNMYFQILQTAHLQYVCW